MVPGGFATGSGIHCKNQSALLAYSCGSRSGADFGEKRVDVRRAGFAGQLFIMVVAHAVFNLFVDRFYFRGCQFGARTCIITVVPKGQRNSHTPAGKGFGFAEKAQICLWYT